MFGNSVDKHIRSEDDAVIKRLSGKVVTLEIKTFDGDIYSINFR